jgi:outer membrane protein assembly factor BamB
MILAVNDGEIAAFAGTGRGAWRYETGGSVLSFAGSNDRVAVFVDQFGDITGLDVGSGDVIFTWGGAAADTSVAVDEALVYRTTGAEVAARPVRGEDVVWTTELVAVEALFTVPGTLLAQDAIAVYALEPATGEVRWSIPFEGEVAPPIVLGHDELHLAARQGSIGFDTLWHLDPADGSTIFRGTAPPNTEWFPEMDDELLLQVGEDGTVAAIDMLQRVVWTVATGANRIDRFTQAEVAADGSVVTLSFSAERF